MDSKMKFLDMFRAQAPIETLPLPLIEPVVSQQEAIDAGFESYLVNGKRSFEAAMFSRENSTWQTVDFSPTQELFTQLNWLRVRAREAYRNYPIVSNFVSLMQENIVGHKGFTLKSTVQNAHKGINNTIAGKIEDGWNDFCKQGNLDVSGLYNLKSALDLATQSLAIDGEILIRKIYGQGKYGIQIQLLHAEQLIVTQHENYIMGVYRDEFGKPISYCLTLHDPRDGFISYLFEPAEHVIHAYLPYMVNAPRGIPMISASLMKMRMLEEYEKAELIAARISASAFIKYSQTQPDDLELTQDQIKKSILQAGPKKSVIEPGQGMVLPPGVDMEYVKSEHPSTAFEAFVREVRKEIAAGMGISVNSLIGDFEHTSFSSMRGAYIMERNFYRKQQTLFIEKVLSPLFESWIDAACASGALDLPPVLGSYDFYKQHQFSGVAFAFVDVLKEVQSQSVALANRTTSRTKLCEEMGTTYSDVLDDLSNEHALEAQKGIHFACLPKNTVLEVVPEDVEIMGLMVAGQQATEEPEPKNVQPINDGNEDASNGSEDTI
jgi:lambda family phage portal protein